MRILVNLHRSRESREDVEDVLLAPVSSLEELADLCTKVADTAFNKKLARISYIILDIIFVVNLKTIDARIFFFVE